MYMRTYYICAYIHIYVIFQRNINISILSPRKIPALYKLFEKAGGDLQSSQTKNYAKDPRHLVLLRNYNLKERPVSPQMGGNVHNTAATAAQIPLSPLQSNDSPNTNQVQQNIAPPNQQQGPPFRNQAPPQNITSVHQTVTPSMAAPMNTARPPYNPQIAAPPNYHPPGVNIATRPRWMRPFIAPGATAPANTQGSALIAQLTQPPSSLGLNVAAFNQRLDGKSIDKTLTVLFNLTFYSLCCLDIQSMSVVYILFILFIVYVLDNLHLFYSGWQ